MDKCYENIESLLSCAGYRDFIRTALVLKARAKRPLTYAALARKAGFAARSFPRDVITGSKRLTADSAPRFAEALDLTADLRAYFLALVNLEEGLTRIPSYRQSERLEKMRQRLRFRQEGGTERANSIYVNKACLEIYAALGASDVGANVDEISLRTAISVAECRNILATLSAKGLVNFSSASGRYLPCAPHLIFEQLGGAAQFQRWFLESLVTARSRALADFATDRALYFNSVFSVAKVDMPRLKQELREVVLRYIDGAENAGGDAIAKLTLALHL